MPVKLSNLNELVAVSIPDYGSCRHVITSAAINLHPHRNMIMIGPRMNPDKTSCYGRAQRVVYNCIPVGVCSKNLQETTYSPCIFIVLSSTDCKNKTKQNKTKQKQKQQKIYCFSKTINIRLFINTVSFNFLRICVKYCS